MTKRKVFFISDRTGITAETLGGSLLTQFPKIQFTKTFIPFVTDVTSAKNAVSKIIEQTKVDGEDPIVFSTLTDPEILSIIATSSPNVFDLFGTFVGPLEKALESNCRVPMVAFLLRNGKPIAYGVNKKGFRGASIHAEIDCLRKVRCS